MIQDMSHHKAMCRYDRMTKAPQDNAHVTIQTAEAGEDTADVFADVDPDPGALFPALKRRCFMRRLSSRRVFSSVSAFSFSCRSCWSWDSSSLILRCAKLSSDAS